MESLQYLNTWREKILTINPDFPRRALLGVIDNAISVVEKEKQNFAKAIEEHPTVKIGELKEKSNLGGMIKLCCPYCNHENFDMPFQKSEGEYTCPNCKKMLKVIVGDIRLREGHFKTAGYGPTPYSLRLKLREGEERMIAFTTDYKFHANAGDYVGLVYKKSWLSGNNYSSNPSHLINWTLGERFKLN